MDELRFVCKLCNKKYPCGKSLGGHMRSHVVSAYANESDVKFDESGVIVKEAKLAELANGQTSYGLRENPRKTWRAVDSKEERVCKQCGKIFQSIKALCGHMACHSERDRGGIGSKDDQSSWTSENPKTVLDSCSDTEVEDGGRMRMRTRLSKSRVCKKVADELRGSSSMSEINEHSHEEVAMCLIMLSMDNSVVESSDNNSVILETKSSSIGTRTFVEKENKAGDNLEPVKSDDSDSDSAYFLEECAKAEVSDAASVDECKNPDGVRTSLKLIMSFQARVGKEHGYYDEDEMMSIFAGIESRKRKCSFENAEPKKNQYECLNCKKTFKSYQALGGHRPCYKRANVFYDESDENSLCDSTEYRTAAAGKVIESSSQKKLIAKNPSVKPKNKNGHICPFCNRVFKNGQALGGHKRSHFIGGGGGGGGGYDKYGSRSSRAKKPEPPDLLDLNLPAPEE